MKVRLVIDAVVLHGLPVGKSEAFVGELGESIEGELRGRAGVMNSSLPLGRDVVRERISENIPSMVDGTVSAAALGSGIVMQAWGRNHA